MSEQSVKMTTIRGWTRPTTLHFRIAEVWGGGAGYGSFVFVEDPSDAMWELLSRLCTWGGPTKPRPGIENLQGWEIHKEQLPCLWMIIERTKHLRPEDNPDALRILESLILLD